MWQFHCHVSDHIIAGMLARYQVLAPAQPGPEGHAPEDHKVREPQMSRSSPDQRIRRHSA
ncbi:MAG: hypothetical protein ACRDUW_25870 [Pseudonocardiaceae bacterium]